MEISSNRNYILERMKARTMKVSEFNFERLTAPPLAIFFSPDDINQLRKLATSIKYSGKPRQKLQLIDNILKARGFRKVTGGTNRVIYKHLEFDDILIKVAIDATGITDNPREYQNQFYYKPFVPKVFEVTPCGTVGLFEKVIPITSRTEFMSVASDIYDVIRNWFTGDYVMDDIGTDYFLNWGIRKGFGPVLLDFPYSYPLDGNKLYCNAPNNKTGEPCGGVIDYDDGYNHLQCTKCGARYKAIELRKAIDNQEVIIERGERRMKMKVAVGYGDDVKVVSEINKDPIEKQAQPAIRKPSKKQIDKVGTLKVRFGKSDVVDVKKERELRETSASFQKLKVVVGDSKVEEEAIDTTNPSNTSKFTNLKVATVSNNEETDPAETLATDVYGTWVKKSRSVIKEGIEKATIKDNDKTVVVQFIDDSYCYLRLESVEDDTCKFIHLLRPNSDFTECSTVVTGLIDEIINMIYMAYGTLEISSVNDFPFSLPVGNVNEESSEETADEEEEDIEFVRSGYHTIEAVTTNTAELVETEELHKCLIPKDENVTHVEDAEGNMYTIAITKIDGIPLDDLCIITSDAYDEIISALTKFKTDNANLLQTIDELNAKIAELEKPKKQKRDPKGRFVKEEEGNSFDTSSPFIPEKEEKPEEENIPVGAAPPKAKSDGNKNRSKRYDADFYGENKGSKGTSKK